MSFYQEIVTAYDEIFPLNPKQLSYVEGMCKLLSGKKILDAGCGTGSLAIALGRRSASVNAFDLDVDMINKAKEKCPQAIDVNFKEGDLLKMTEAYKGSSFDIVYCFGNTLVHLSGLKEVEQFVSSARNLLKPKGKLLLQVINYDRILKKEVKSLPSIESDHYIFERLYRITDDGYVEFTSNLTSKRSGQQQSQKVLLFPIIMEQINAVLKLYFSKVTYYASFNREDWNEDSFHTVIEAEV